MLRLLGLVFACYCCLVSSGCVTPNARAGFMDPIAEHAVDYGKAKYVDPFVRDAMPIVDKHFGGNAAGSHLPNLNEPTAVPVDSPNDVLWIVVCTLNANGQPQRCEKPQKVYRSDWPEFWKENQGGWKFPNGKPLKKFTTLRVDRADKGTSYLDNYGPELPITIVQDPPVWQPSQAPECQTCGTYQTYSACESYAGPQPLRRSLGALRRVPVGLFRAGRWLLFWRR